MFCIYNLITCSYVLDICHFFFIWHMRVSCMMQGVFTLSGSPIKYHFPFGYFTYGRFISFLNFRIVNDMVKVKLFSIPRFTAEAKARRDPIYFMPFSAGPRNCIGMRLAQLEIRITIVKILQTFTVKPCAKTQVAQ